VIQNRGFLFLSKFLGTVLIVAGLLKAHQITSGESLLDEAWWNSPILLGTTALFEVLFGSWLWTGLYPFPTWLASVLCFLAFACVAFVRAWAGEASCGCLGAFDVNPWVMILLDAAALLALLVFQPNDREVGEARTFRGRLALFGLSTGLLLVVGSIALYLSRPGRLEADGQLTTASAVVVLEPRDWVGKLCPLLKHIDIGEKLGRGDWILMMYRWDCDKCQPWVSQYVALGHALRSQSGGLRVALVELPPIIPALPTDSSAAACSRGRLREDRRWVTRAPVFLRLKSGVVDVVTEEPEELLRAPFEPADEQGRIVAASAPETVGGIFPNFRQMRRNLFLSEIACGPLALLAVLRDLGINLPAEEAEAVLAEAGSQGIDMLQLKRLAEGYGLHALGVAVTPEKLRQMSQHAIVQFNEVGFVAVVGYRPGAFHVVYPQRPLGLMPDDLFARSFGETGNALLLSKSPLLPKRLGLLPAPDEKHLNGPRLRSSRSMLTAGRMHRYGWEAEVDLINVGTEQLRILDIKSSCPSCFKMEVGAKELNPGQSTKLRAKGKAIMVGGFLHHIELTTNQLEQPVVHIPVRGYVEEPVGFEKPAAMFPKVMPGEAAEMEVDLEVSPLLSPEELRVQVPPKVPLIASVRRKSDGRVVLALKWQGTAAPGWHRVPVGIRADSPDAVRALFHAAVEIVPATETFPPSVLVRDDELGTAWQRRIEVAFHRKSGGPPKVEWADPRLRGVIGVTCKPIDERRWCVVLEPAGTADLAVRPGRAELTIRSSDGADRRVAVFFGEISLSQSQSMD
jgi:hypothetical protein